MAEIKSLDALVPKDLPTPPFIILPGLPNLRDIGGYPLANPPSLSKKSIRRGLIFRSADTSAVSHYPASCTALASTLNVKTVFDLRAGAEVTRGSFGPPLKIDGIERVHAPTNKEDMSPEALAARYREYAHGGDEGFMRAYSSILASAGPSVKVITRHLLDNPTTPILYHCTAGKDRTAIVTALLLSLAGVAPATIAYEYALTTEGLAGLRESIIAHLLTRPDMQGDREAVERMAGSRAPAMEKTLVLLDKEYGGAAGWLTKEAGLTGDELKQLQALLTSEEEPIFDAAGQLVAGA